MEMNFKLNCRASSISSGVRIMVPSSRMISQHRPHSSRPARRIRSTVASVWPLRSSTPLAFAISGNIWPGRRKSDGRAPGCTTARAVSPRSCAEMPVVVSTWSMDTVKAVSWLSVFSVTIWGNASFWYSSADMGMQMSPLPCTAMKFTFSVVANCAAQMKSPSFSRSGSSVHRMILPARKSSSASSIVLNWNDLFSSMGCSFVRIHALSEMLG